MHEDGFGSHPADRVNTLLKAFSETEREYLKYGLLLRLSLPEDEGDWPNLAHPCEFDVDARVTDRGRVHDMQLHFTCAGGGVVDLPIIAPEWEPAYPGEERPPREVEHRERMRWIVEEAKASEALRREDDEVAWAQRLLAGERSAKTEQRGASDRPARDLRRQVWERDGGRCVECGSTFDLQYDHVIPFALGGATTFENLQILCSRCNQRKGQQI